MKEARWEKKSISTEKHAPCGSSHRPPPSNPGRAKFSLISLKKFNQPLTWNGELVLGEREGERGGGLGDELGDAARQNELYCLGR